MRQISLVVLAISLLGNPVFSDNPFLRKNTSSDSSLGVTTLKTNSNNPFLRGNLSTITSQDLDSIQDAKVIMILLDASASMAEPSSTGESRIFAAKRVLKKVLSEVDSTAMIGLRVYGSSSPSLNDHLNCQDSKLIVSPGHNNRATIINRLREVKPSGATPISLSIREAIKDMQHLKASKKAIMLISDGMDTCGYDPCSLAGNLSMTQNGSNVQISTIGFGIQHNLAAVDQLECIAKKTEGKYYPVNNANELAESLLNSINSYTKIVTGTVRELE